MLKTNAVPTVAGEGVFADAEFQNEVREVTPPGGVTISSVITRALNFANAALKVIFCGLYETQSHIIATPDAAFANAAFADGVGNPVITLTPEAGQTGRSLTWAVTIEGNGNAANKIAVLEAIEALINPARPKWTAGALAQAIVANYPNLFEENPFGVCIDQNTGTIKVVIPSDDALIVAMKAAAAAANNALIVDIPVVEITDQPTNPSALKFEGGSF